MNATNPSISPVTEKRPSQRKKAASTLPGNESIARCIRPKLERYYSKRGSMIAATLDDAERLRLLAEYAVVDIMKQNIKAGYDSQAMSLEEFFHLLKRYTKKQDRILSRIEKRVSFGPKCQNLIFIIANLVISKMRKLDIDTQEEYASGKFKTYTLKTSTRSLAKVLNQLHISTAEGELEDEDNGEASFRGKSGLYAALLDCGFILRKQNRKLNGELDAEGFSIELTIDLDWIFGYSLQIPMGSTPQIAMAETPQSGNTTHLSYTISKDSTKASGVQNLADNCQELQKLCPPNFKPVQPTIVGYQNPSVQGQASKPLKPVSQENFAPAPGLSTADVENALKIAITAEKYAAIACKTLVRELYTQENFDKKRIRINKFTTYNFISSQDWERMMDKMFENYYHIQQKVGDWKQTHDEILETIQKIGKYYQTNGKDYIYAPLHLLKTDMATRSLAFAHKLYFPSETQNSTQNPKPKTQNPQFDALMFVPDITEYEYENYNWLIKERKEYSLSLARYAKKLGKDVVDDAIRFVRCKYKRGFRSKNDIVSYILGVIRNLDNTDEAKAKIKADANEQEALHKAGLQIGQEFTRHSPLTTQHSGGESASDSAPIDPLKAFVDKVKPIAIKVAKKYNTTISPEQITKVAQRAIEKGANEDQIYIWCEGIAKGISKIF